MSKNMSKHFWEEDIILSETDNPLDGGIGYEVHRFTLTMSNSEEARLKALTDYDGNALYMEDSERRKNAYNPDLLGQAYQEWITEMLNLEKSLPTIYTTAKGRALGIMGVALVAVAHDFGYKAIRDKSPTLAHEIRNDLLSEVVAALVAKCPWAIDSTITQPESEDARKEIVYKVARETIKAYLKIHTPINLKKAVAQARRLYKDLHGCDIRTAKRRSATIIDCSWLEKSCLPSTSWEAAEEMAYDGDTQTDSIALLIEKVHRDLRPGDIATIVSLVYGRKRWPEISHNEPRKAARIKRALLKNGITL